MKYILFILSIFLIPSCSNRLGNLTMVSTRNVDSKTEYVELKRSVKGKSKDLEGAIEKAVKSVSGGEFMKNVVISYNGKIKVEGDVWGVSGVLSEKEKKEQEKAAKKYSDEDNKKQELENLKSSFNTGDKVSWKNIMGKILIGEIVGKGNDKAIIKTVNDGVVKNVEVSYHSLIKME